MKKIVKTIFLSLYLVVVSFWVISGFAVQRIIRDHQYVVTTYAHEIAVNDVTYFYRQAGQLSSPPVVLIHGFLGSSYDFIEVMDALKQDYLVYAIDLIGFGLSEKSMTFHYAKANQAASLAVLFEALNIDQAIIMAHSMGGEVALHLAHDYPALVASMILIGSGGYYVSSPGLIPPRLPVFFYDHVVNNYYLQRAFFYSAYSDYEVDNRLVTYDDYDEMYVVNRTIPGKVMQKFTFDNDSGTTNAKLPLITQEITLIWGEFDGFIPLSTGELLQAALGDNASLKVMPNAGHLPFDTFLDEFMVLVREHLI
jgi:pimeloyl-ACP methyl ester carboxylesterase